MNNNTTSSYRQIIKSTSLFGGVQGFNILVNIVRSKVVAVLLGPAGMGVAGLFMATIAIIDSLTNLGLVTSAVKDIAVASERADKNAVSKVITVFRRLVWFTGFLGAFITIVFSNYLSEVTFGNEKYSNAFVWLSVTLLFTQLTSGQQVLLQGLRKLNYLAKANVLGSVLGLVISFPLYYYLAVDGIVPAMIITSICTLFIFWYFARKIELSSVVVSPKESSEIAQGMVKMGVIISLSSLSTLLASYIVRVYIGKSGGVTEVGLYNAGFAIIGTYVGMVFTAMGTDYYPRLSAIAPDSEKSIQLINHQAEIAILILAPILCLFFIFINWVILLLYSAEFIKISDMVRFAALGMYFKSVSWSVGFILLAKGASGTFLWNELIANSYLLILHIVCYNFFGLDGLGVSFLIGYSIHFVQIFFLTKYKYGFKFQKGFYKIFTVQFILGTLCFFAARKLEPFGTYMVGLLFIALSTYYSYYELDKRLGLSQILQQIRLKFSNKDSFNEK